MSVVVSGSAVAALALGALTAGFIVESNAPAPLRPHVVHRGPPGPAQIELVGPSRGVASAGPDQMHGPQLGLVGEVTAVTELCEIDRRVPTVDLVLCSLGGEAPRLLETLHIYP